jgi:large subunit ribosomal protein L24
MAKATIKKNNVVFVIAGADKGKSGKVLSVDSKSSRVTVEGVAVRKKTIRRSQEHPNGGIEEREFPIHISNVMAEERYRAKRSEK